MELNISINLDNAAFEDNCDKELSDIFKGIIQGLQLVAGEEQPWQGPPTHSRAILDSNGNTIGRFATEDK